MLVVNAVTLLTLLIIHVCTEEVVERSERTQMLRVLAEALESVDERADKFKALVNEIQEKPKNSLKTTVKPRRSQLACPIPLTFVETARDEKECRIHSNCRSDELCCNWHTKRHCLKGLIKTPKPGVCPEIGPLNDFCLSDHVSCRYDSECAEPDEKCCENTLCGYRECLSIRQNLACPVVKGGENTERKEKPCLKNTQCGTDELCCDWFDNKYCLKGISTIQKRGLCPMLPPDGACIQDTASCFHDSECPGKMEKCCFNPKCGYHECRDMNAEFACPTINLDDARQRNQTCSSHDDCNEFTVLCCDIKGQKKCTDALYKVPKQGQCPKTTPVGKSCQTGSEGDCEYDFECMGNAKCCKTSCGYKQCVGTTQKREEEDTEGDNNQDEDTTNQDENKRELMDELVKALRQL